MLNRSAWIGRFGLWIDLALGERAYELPKRAMLGGGIEQIRHSGGLNTQEGADRKCGGLRPRQRPRRSSAMLATIAREATRSVSHARCPRRGRRDMASARAEHDTDEQAPHEASASAAREVRLGPGVTISLHALAQDCLVSSASSALPRAEKSGRDDSEETPRPPCGLEPTTCVDFGGAASCSTSAARSASTVNMRCS